MKTIKFRAWNDEAKKMSVFTLKEAASWEGDTNVVTAECPIMQYTGLKDRNGKEIYEGDVVKWEKIKRKYERFFIEYHSDVMGFVATESKDVHARTVRMSSKREKRPIEKGRCLGLEVIGNVYENPELLNSKEV